MDTYSEHPDSKKGEKVFMEGKEKMEEKR